MAGDVDRVSVMVRSLAGGALFGPAELPRSTTALALKGQVAEASGVSSVSVKLIFGAAVLGDADTLAGCGDGPVLELSAAIVKGLRAVVWGDPHYGGTLPVELVEPLSSGVASICSTSSAFAALKDAGQVFAWGLPECGGDCSEVAEKLSEGVVSIAAGGLAFAALKEDGSVVTWGHPEFGGCSASVREALAAGVIAVYGGCTSFCAAKADGSMVAWGDRGRVGGLERTGDAGGSVGPVLSMAHTSTAFAAITEGGRVVAWGGDGGDTSLVQDELQEGIVTVVGCRHAFAAVKTGGKVVVWGLADTTALRVLPKVRAKLQEGVVSVCNTEQAFAALKSDGSVVTWGYTSAPDKTVLEHLASNVVSIHSAATTFAAVKADSLVVMWSPDGRRGMEMVRAVEKGTRIYGDSRRCDRFLGITPSGGIVTFQKSSGRRKRDVEQELNRGVVSVCGTMGAYAALQELGAVRLVVDVAQSGRLPEGST